MICLILLFFFTLCFSCDSENSEASTHLPQSGTSDKADHIIFTKILSAKSNVDFKNILIDDPLDPAHNVMENANYFSSGGTAIADFDNDGLSDIFFVGNEVQNRVYKNLGNFKFEDKTETASVNDKKGWGNGVTIVDINNDGF